LAGLGARGHSGNLGRRHSALLAPPLKQPAARKESSILIRNPALRLTLGGCLTLLLACASSHKVPPPSTEIDDSVFRNDIRLLASDEFEGRKPGTPGEDKTVAFLTSQFRKLGLKPAVGESYVQQVPLVEISAARDTTLAVSGRGAAERLHYGKEVILWTGRAVPQASLHRSELVFVGFGIVAPEYGWNDYTIDVRDKTVLVLAGDPGTASKDPGVFKGSTLSLYGRWDYKVEEAVRHGAAGVLLIHDAAVLGYEWAAAANTFSSTSRARRGPESASKAG
jgi:hypothetical protein